MTFITTIISYYKHFSKIKVFNNSNKIIKNNNLNREFNHLLFVNNNLMKHNKKYSKEYYDSKYNWETRNYHDLWETNISDIKKRELYKKNINNIILTLDNIYSDKYIKNNLYKIQNIHSYESNYDQLIKYFKSMKIEIEFTDNLYTHQKKFIKYNQQAKYGIDSYIESALYKISCIIVQFTAGFNINMCDHFIFGVNFNDINNYNIIDNINNASFNYKRLINNKYEFIILINNNNAIIKQFKIHLMLDDILILERLKYKNNFDNVLGNIIIHILNLEFPLILFNMGYLIKLR
jgi:hypothetical protein